MRILLFAEGATLAHVGRPLVLAQQAATLGHEVIIAAPDRYDWATRDCGVEVRSLEAQSPEVFAARLAAGKPLYDFETLDRSVGADRVLIRSVKPDLVIGDFRLSLSVSARLENVRYITLSNAYWSPFFRLPGPWPVPDLPLSRFLPITVARWLFNLARPIAFGQHAQPMERLRKAYGLAGFGSDLRAVYTDADETCYCDQPSLFRLADAPASHRVVGPLVWSPGGELPIWWDRIPTDRPVVYLSLGSSGRADLVVPAARALARAGLSVILSTAGAELDADIAGVFPARFLPGRAACDRADIVVCNGGSPGTQQALAAGKPVIGIASNLDQFLNMGVLEAAGVGRILRADRFDPDALLESTMDALADPGTLSVASRLAVEMAELTPDVVTRNIVGIA